MENIFYLIPLFFGTAATYSLVGFGGGSTYLALLALFNFPYESIPKIALLCNLIVVSGGLYHYIKKDFLPIQKILPFLLTSIPFAYLGGKMNIPRELFFILLGISLGIAGLRLLFKENSLPLKTLPSPLLFWIVGLISGGIIGFFSGVVGIGGGIFLAPLLYFLRWGEGREIAAMSSFFIFVNSLSGLWGQFSKSTLLIGSEWILPLGLAVFVGGQLGSRMSCGWSSLSLLRRVTAVFILTVSARLFWRFL